MSMSFKASPDGTYGEILVNGQVVAKLPVSGNAVIPNLVGAVSQSGGIPTGAVVERGSNANGEYVRFADGTQICTTMSQMQSIGAGGVFGYFFNNSAAFVEVPRSVFTRTSNGLALELQDGMDGHTINGATVFVRNNGSTTRDVVVFYLAIGRWY